MSMKRSILVLALAIGCGDSGGGGGHTVQNKPYPACSDCMHAQYVVGPNMSGSAKGIVIPASNSMASQLGCDIDGDGQVDNLLGKVFATLKTQNLDVQSAVDTSFMNGSVIILMDVEYKPSVTDTMTAGLKGFIGAHDMSDGLMAPNFFYGGGKFTVQTTAGDGMGGAVMGGTASFGPGSLKIQFPLVMGQMPLNADLEAASVTGVVSMTSITSGIICGAIPADELKTQILPLVANLLSNEIQKGGSTADTIKSLFDADMSCNTDPACQMGATGTCMCITESEVENNTIIKSLLSPDLDLDPNKTNPFVTDTSDPTYKNDALSIGIGFNANSAMFPAQ